MAIADWLRAKYVKPPQEKNEAIRQERIAREEAEERGETFNEPEPYQDEE